MKFRTPISYKNNGNLICENASAINFKQSANVPSFNESPRKKINIVGNNSPIPIRFWSFSFFIYDNLTPSYLVPFQTGTQPNLLFYSISGKSRYYFRYGGILKNLFISVKNLGSGSKILETTVMIGSGAGSSTSTNLLTSLIAITTSYTQSSNNVDVVSILPYDWIEIRCASGSGQSQHAINGSLDFYPNFGA